MHRSIEEVATKVASELRSGVASLYYPPNSGLTDDENRAIAELRSIVGLESALRKIVASAASFPLYHLIGILYAGPQHTIEGEARVVLVPTQQKAVAVAGIPNNLGIIIKADRLLAFEGMFR